MIKIAPQLLLYQGTDCTCGMGGYYRPELHKNDCAWRLIAEQDNATDWAQREARCERERQRTVSDRP